MNLLWNGAKWLFKAIALPVTKLRGMRGFRQFVRWSLHFVCVAVALLGLWYLNYSFELEKVLRVPFPLLRQVWLPLLAFTIYLLTWVGWWLWRLMGSNNAVSQHPDIDRAWQEATAALEQAGIDITQTPLFLVLGQPSGTETDFFNATRLPFTVPQVPRGEDSPLRVCANNEAVYVTCAELSLLGHLSGVLAEFADVVPTTQIMPVAGVEEQPLHVSPESDVDVMSFDSQQTFGDPVCWDDERAAATARQAEHGLALLEQNLDMVEQEQRGEEPLLTDVEVASRKMLRKQRLNELRNAEQVEHLTSRMRHLCKLIARDRQPYCPLNGILILIPYAATASDQDANRAAVLINRDLEAIRNVMQVQCPLITLVCDTEQAPGCQELLRRFPEQQRRRRLGVHFPPVADSDADSVPEVVDEGIRWMCQELLPPLVYRLLQLAPQNDPHSAHIQQGNVELYQFLHELRQRERRISRILKRGICAEGTRPGLLGGCFLGATGSDVVRDQGFVAGVMPQLLEMQNMLSWTPEALHEDASCRWWSRAGYVGLAAFVGSITMLAILL